MKLNEKDNQNLASYAITNRVTTPAHVDACPSSTKPCTPQEVAPQFCNLLPAPLITNPE